jgi:hypothetical protein
MLEFIERNWLKITLSSVSILFGLLYINYVVNFTEVNYFLVCLEVILMGMCSGTVVLTNYSSKNDSNYGFSYLCVNLIPFGLGLLSLIFTGPNTVFIHEIMAYTLFLIPQIGSFSILSFTTKSR